MLLFYLAHAALLLLLRHGAVRLGLRDGGSGIGLAGGAVDVAAMSLKIEALIEDARTLEARVTFSAGRRRWLLSLLAA